MSTDPIPPDDELISLGAAAKAIGINKSTLSRQVKSGAIRSHQGKVRLSEVREDRAKNIGTGSASTRSKTLKPDADKPPLHATTSRVAPSATVQRDATPASDATPTSQTDATPSVAAVSGWISLGAAAKAIGLNKSTLSRQVKSGAIRSKDGKVRLAEVLEDRAKNIDLSQARRSAQASLPLNGPTPGQDRPSDDDELKDLENIEDLEVLVDGKVMKFADAQALKETYLAKTRQLEFLEKTGTLVSRKAAEKLWFDEGREARDAWLSWPGRVSTLMASELGVEEPLLTETLARYVQQHLVELGEPPAPELAAGN